MELILDRGRWICGAEIDGGGFGRVFDVVDPAGIGAVAKFVKKAPGAERELLLADLTAVDGYRNVVPVIDQGEHGDSWVIVMPKASTSLDKYLRANVDGLDVAEVVAAGPNRPGPNASHDVTASLVVRRRRWCPAATHDRTRCTCNAER